LPAIGGALLLRAEVGRGDPPVLILQSARGEEHRIEPGPQTRFNRSADFLVPAGLRWAVAALVWPHGARAVLPGPPDGRGEVIDLASRRPAPAPPEKAAGGPAPLPWTAPPFEEGADAAAVEASEAEPTSGETVNAIPPGVRSELSVLEAVAQLTAVREELARARDEITHLRTALETERIARVSAEAALGVPVPPGDLTELAIAQATHAAATAPRRPSADSDRLVAALEAAASSLRASTPPPGDAKPITTSRLVAAAAALASAAPTTNGDVAVEDTSALGSSGPAAPLDGATAAALEAGAAPAPVASGLAASPLSSATAPAVPTSTLDGTSAPDGSGSASSALDAGSAPAPLDGATVPVPSAPLPAASAPAPEEAVTAEDAALAHRPIIVASVAARAAAQAAAEALVPVVAPAPGLRRALLTLAREDSVTAGAVLAGLLPAQGAVLEESLSYDLTVRGYGTFAVTVGHGGTEVQRLTKRRPRKEAAFHVSGEPLVLAELLTGDRTRLGRFRPSARITGRRRQAQALRALSTTPLSLGEAVQAGARLEPALVYAALPHAVAPEWTRGHVFTIAQEITELGPRAWYVTARDGVRLSVVEHAAGAAADATVTMSRAAFDRLLKGEPPTPGDLPVIRGDRAAVAALKRWTDLARG
jgi:hypothetical protein